jgi:predicted metal-dependent HD superfamily phosphohydrolase
VTATGEAWIARDAPWLCLEQGRARQLLLPVAEAYREPQRRYHDETHLGEMLDAVHALRQACRDFRAVLLAAWFHDAVYRPERSDNEEQSALRARRALEPAGFDPELTASVERLVLTTRPGAAVAGDADAEVLSDGDRRVWAAPPARYAAYARGIRAEYGRFSWTAYAHGRGRFLAGSLRRADAAGRLFFHFGTAEEAAARANLARERRCLALPRVWLHRLAGRDPLAALVDPRGVAAR